MSRRNQLPPELPPILIDAERSIIGAVLLDNRAAESVHLEPEDFSQPGLRLIWGAVKDLARAHEKIDSLTIESRLNGHGRSVVELSDCLTALPTVDNVTAYETIVKHHSLDRRLRIALSELAHERRLEGEELLARAARTLESLTPPPQFRPDSADAYLLAPVAAQMAYPTRFPRLNALVTGGIKSRQLVVFAAPPGGGKTYLVGTLAADLSETMPTLIVSTEIDGVEMAARIAGQRMGCTADDILAHRRLPSEAAAYVHGPIFIWFLDGDTDPLSKIRALMNAVRTAAGSYPALFVDYLQGLVEDLPEKELRHATTRTANALRRMAQEFDVPVVCASTTSRPFYAPKDRPNDPIAFLAAFKESGGIESAASVAMYLDIAREMDADGWYPGRFAISKARRGKLGFVPVRMHGPHGVFEEVSPLEHATGMSRIHSREDDRILDWIRAQPTPPTKERIATEAGLQKIVARFAVERLVAAGRLRAVSIRIPNGARSTRLAEGYCVLNTKESV